MKRIYYNYEKWEDYQYGMYEEPIKVRIMTGETQEERIEKALFLLTNERLCKEYMKRVVNEWTYACSQVFTNLNMNRSAWLVKASCCLYAGIKESETIKAWEFLSPRQKQKVSLITLKLIKKWSVNK